MNDLLIDEREMHAQYIEVATGVFFGMGARSFLIPVDAITNTTNDLMMINLQREKLTRAPVYNPSRVDENMHRKMYTFFDSPPFWSPDYTHPTFVRCYE